MLKKIIHLLTLSVLILCINCIAMGELNASIETGGADARINLTVEGSADWAYWTRLSLEPENSKAGADDIGPLTTIGNLGLQDNTSLTGWDVEFSDGTDPVSGSADNLGNRIRISSTPNQDEGYRLTVKAGVEPRILKLYIHNRETPSTIRAILGDEILETPVPYRVTGDMGDCSYTLVFSHPTANELTIEYFCPAGASPTYTLRLAVATLSGELVLKHLNAYNPSPDNEQTDVSRDTILSWSPGQYANKHNVYFGTDFDNVSNADIDNPLNTLVGPNQSSNTYNPGRLEFDQIYYWRIDEVNAPPESTVIKGGVWSFTVEPVAYPIAGGNITATASSQAPDQGPETTINGSGLVDDLHSIELTDMWQTSDTDTTPVWIQFEFDTVYKLHEMLVWNFNGPTLLSMLGLKDVVVEYSLDGANWDQLNNIAEFARATGLVAYAANTTVAFDDVTAKYVRITANSNWSNGIFNQFGLSEVRFMAIPVSARLPSPAIDETDVALDVTLGWRAGREAAEHRVYISTDEKAVIDGTSPVSTVTEAGSGPLSLDLGSMYFWRVDEVNGADIWRGDIWSFSTQEYLVIDDFESYNDITSGQPGSHLVYETWMDGFASPATNGSTIGYASGMSMETGIVHGGGQSVPLLYNNTSAVSSEVTVNTSDLTIGQDWTIGSPKALVLWVYGDPNNTTTEQMYVKVNTAQVILDINLTQADWQECIIDLISLGINLNNVTTLSIGLERTGAVGGSGMVFIDDILLYTPLDEQTVFIADNGNE